MAAAGEGGCEALLELLLQQPGCLLAGGRGRSPYVAAARNGDRATLAALRRLGVPWGAVDVVVQAVRKERCRLDVVRWLVEQGAPVGCSTDWSRCCGGGDQNGLLSWRCSCAA